AHGAARIHALGTGVAAGGVDIRINVEQVIERRVSSDIFDRNRTLQPIRNPNRAGRADQGGIGRIDRQGVDPVGIDSNRVGTAGGISGIANQIKIHLQTAVSHRTARGDIFAGQRTFAGKPDVKLV